MTTLTSPITTAQEALDFINAQSLERIANFREMRDNYYGFSESNSPSEMNDYFKSWKLPLPPLVATILSDADTSNVLEDAHNWSDSNIYDLSDSDEELISEISASIYDRLFNSLTQVWVTPETEGQLLLNGSLIRSDGLLVRPE